MTKNQFAPEDEPIHFRSIFISDIHLGTRFSQAEELLEFFKFTRCENLYLVGDIIDGWAIKRKIKWAQSHSDVIQKILRKARKGTNVYYITGNHDDFLRSFLPLGLGDRVKSSVSFITDFEAILSEHAKRHHYDGVICGHIHKVEHKEIDGIVYLNCGNWVESCTAIVETYEGEFKIIRWLGH